jgi:hypothetical protein
MAALAMILQDGEHVFIERGRPRVRFLKTRSANANRQARHCQRTENPVTHAVILQAQMFRLRPAVAMFFLSFAQSMPASKDATFNIHVRSQFQLRSRVQVSAC